MIEFRSGWRHSLHGRKDDVRPAGKSDGRAYKRREKETRHAQELHETTSRDGLLEGEILLKVQRIV